MKYQEELIELSSKIWEYSELKFEEFKSVAALKETLEKHNFKIENNLADIPTAFSASYGSGKPVIAILGEFDALSGLSQVADLAEPKLREGTNNGHGCGHHIFGAGSVGAAILVKEYMEKNNLNGTLIFYGCPGEEGGSGKAFMANRGIFDNIDAALCWHPFNANGVWVGSFLANKQVYVRFHGKASHAAASPQLGRSALDALELVNIGVNFLREHMDDIDRIHYSITNSGGISPNVVQNFAEGLYLVRSKNSNTLNSLYERFEKIVQGAGLMTETTPEIVFDKCCSEIVTNSVIEKALYESFTKLGPTEFTEEEIEYAKKFRATFTKENIDGEMSLKMVDDVEAEYKRLNDKYLCDYIYPYVHKTVTNSGSSDVGDVSAKAPTAQILTACYAIGTPVHSWQQVAQGKSSIAFKGMIKASEVLADTAIKLLTDNELLEKAKAEFNEKVKDREANSMPKDAMPLILRNKK